MNVGPNRENDIWKLEEKFHFRPENLLGTRVHPEKEGMFEAMATLFFPTVFGRKEWKKLVDEKKISSFLHASTEAFVILAIENNYKYWLRWWIERYVRL